MRESKAGWRKTANTGIRPACITVWKADVRSRLAYHVCYIFELSLFFLAMSLPV